ncbi:MAG: hypothetical protein P8Y64_11925 [Gammaproteobacteria bacterium]|jgi:hypothetical protein
MYETVAIRSKSPSLALIALVLALLLPLPALASANGALNVETQAGPDTRISAVQVAPQETRYLVRGEVRLLPDPLPHSNPGRVVLEAVADGKVVAHSEAVVYRVVTANRRDRLFGFRATLPRQLPPETVLRIRHLPAAR